MSGAALIPLGIIAGSAAGGAAIAKSPPLGAAVGAGIPVGLLALFGYAFAGGGGGAGVLIPIGITAVGASCAAAGAAVSDDHPAVGAAIGAAAPFGLLALLSASKEKRVEEPKKVGTSGAPRYLGHVGGFP